MKCFRYLRDPLFLGCCALYATNRWLIKPHVHVMFFRCWFNDTLLIPCALPPVLMVHRWFGLRAHDAMPTTLEIFAHLTGWAVLFEVIGPWLVPHTTADPWDVVAYAAGAVVALLWWHRGLPKRWEVSEKI